MSFKIEVKNLYKIFGDHPNQAFKLINKGLTKEQIFNKNLYRLLRHPGNRCINKTF